jgi:hypothetical protein
MDKGRGEMKVKLDHQRESIGRGGKNFKGHGRCWYDIDKFSLRNENLSRGNHGEVGGQKLSLKVFRIRFCMEEDC